MADEVQGSQLKNINRILFLFLHPRKLFNLLVEENKPAWLLPLLVISGMLILRILLSGTLQARAIVGGEANLPPDWQWWTPEMQNNYQQAVQATQGPVFNYVIPMISGLAKVWLGWLIVSGLLHLISTFLGGRGSMSSILILCAWAFLPFALRDLLRMAYMLISGHAIASPGLSGFSDNLFLGKLLSGVDGFLIWFAILLIIGLVITDNIPQRKAVIVIVLVLTVILLLQGGMGALSTSLNSMMITRPFFL
jgi:hypothetical protein